SSVHLALPQEVREGEPPPPYDPHDTSVQFDGHTWIPDFAGWTALTYSLDPRIRMTTGVRTDVFAHIHEVAIEPRGELQITVAEPVKVRLVRAPETPPSP